MQRLPPAHNQLELHNRPPRALPLTGATPYNSLMTRRITRPDRNHHGIRCHSRSLHRRIHQRVGQKTPGGMCASTVGDATHIPCSCGHVGKSSTVSEAGRVSSGINEMFIGRYPRETCKRSSARSFYFEELTTACEPSSSGSPHVLCYSRLRR